MKVLRSAAIGFALLGGLAAFGTAADVYVDQNAPGPEHDGTTWDTAFLTLQEGIDAATPYGEVWVADGTYVENVLMGEGVAIYGGFLGAEPGGYEESLDQRDYVNNVTTIDGNQSGSCVVMADEATVDGFTITNGSGKIYELNRTYGGGICCRGVGLTGTIANNVITSNTASFGGGIHCRNSRPTVTDNEITGNNGDWWGGGIHSYAASPTIIGNKIVDNDGGNAGGGIFCEGWSPVISGNEIVGNYAASGAGMGFYASSALVSDNYIAGNTTAYGGYGGGVRFQECPSGVLSDNIIADNSGGRGGGGVACDRSSPDVTHNWLTGNSADAGGGIHSDHGASPLIAYNTFTENWADSGGAIYCRHSSAAIERNTVAANTALRGGGFYFGRDDEAGVHDNIVARNSASMSGGGMCFWDDCAPTVFNNVIVGNATEVSGGGIYCGRYALPTLMCNRVESNLAEYEGGGVCFEAYCSPYFAMNAITGNTALHSGGGVSCVEHSSPTLVGNTLVHNSAPRGAGIYCYMGSSPAIVANTIARNYSADYGAAICCSHECSPTVANNLIAENEAGFWSGGIWCHNSTPVLSHNDFWNNPPGNYWDCEPGEGDISADPVFADPDIGDWHLLFDSPCIDAGTNDAPGLPEFDWDGEERIVNGIVDIGADEFFAYYTEAPDPQPECDGALFGEPHCGFPGWVWFSIPLTPAVSADPNDVLGFGCNGRLHRYDKYVKGPQAYQPPFMDWELSVGDSYILYLQGEVPNPAYDGLSPYTPWEFEFKLGRRGWTWIGTPGLMELGGDDFLDSVRVKYPSEVDGVCRTAREDLYSIPDNWVTWTWPYWNTWHQAAEYFQPYAPFGHTTCYPWVGYRVWVNVGAAGDESDPDQVTLIWPKPGG